MASKNSSVQETAPVTIQSFIGTMLYIVRDHSNMKGEELDQDFGVYSTREAAETKVKEMKKLIGHTWDITEDDSEWVVESDEAGIYEVTSEDFEYQYSVWIVELPLV